MKETILTDRGRQTSKDENEKTEGRTLKRHKKGTKITKYKTQHEDIESTEDNKGVPGL